MLLLFQGLKFLEKYLLGSAPFQQQGAGLFRVHMEGERTSVWLCFKSAVLLLSDMEGLNLGSAAGTDPIVWGRGLFG